MITRLDLYNSAHDFARATLGVTSEHELATKSIAQFNKEKRDPRDWVYWEQQMRAARTRMISLKGVPSDAERAKPKTPAPPAQ